MVLCKNARMSSTYIPIWILYLFGNLFDIFVIIIILSFELKNKVNVTFYNFAKKKYARNNSQATRNSDRRKYNVNFYNKYFKQIEQQKNVFYKNKERNLINF